MEIKYRVRIDPNIPFNKNSFKQFIKKVIHDKRGIRVLFGRGLRLIEVPESYIGNDVKMTINLVSNTDVERICGFDLLSCADRTDGNVYLNWTRWDEGSDVFFNGLWGKYANMNHKEKINLYRIYVTNHEILHILGFDHPPDNINFKGGKSSVMAQQTIDLRGGKSWWWPERSDKSFFKKYHYNQFDL
jgi:hypothetical protein